MIKNHETIKTTRQELYDWVWGLPMTKVALTPATEPSSTNTEKPRMNLFSEN